MSDAPKKPRKPRQKRRFQTLAEKGPAVEMFVWKELLGSYVLQVQKSEQTPSVDANISERDSQWEMVVVIDGKRYVGKRPRLEDAYKATSELLFKHAKKVWLRQDAKVVMAPWSGIDSLMREMEAM